MISIVDYGMGNLRSVQKAFSRVGFEATISSDPEQISASELLVVPGVGAFDRAVRNLKSRGLWKLISQHLHSNKPYLGICLGLQFLFEGSEEGDRSGFGFFQGEVVNFSKVRVVPHMGWNNVSWKPKVEGILPSVEAPCYYFVHSYFPVPDEENIIAGTTEYGGEFCSAVQAGNCLGVQFHPEKSQFAGLALLKNYCQNFYGD